MNDYIDSEFTPKLVFTHLHIMALHYGLYSLWKQITNVIRYTQGSSHATMLSVFHSVRIVLWRVIFIVKKSSSIAFRSSSNLSPSSLCSMSSRSIYIFIDYWSTVFEHLTVKIGIIFYSSHRTLCSDETNHRAGFPFKRIDNEQLNSVEQLFIYNKDDRCSTWTPIVFIILHPPFSVEKTAFGCR